MKTYSILFIALFLSVSLRAQNSGYIKGNLIDKNQAIEFATISLAKSSDTTKALFVETTDSLGHFNFQNIPLGTYLLKASLVGYKTRSQKISLTSIAPNFSLDNFNLSPDNTLLNEVVVTAQKRLIEKTSEGFIVNAAANITQMGGTATDLLKITPTVSVDNDGVVTLRGKSPLILINGRNSNMANPDQIPASSIESIEIITQASSKYDANAESGIINIRLKKNTQMGVNGAFAVGAGIGSRERINSSFLLNHKTKKVNVGLSYDNRFAGRTKTINTHRTNFNLPETYLINQGRNDERVERLQNLKLNIDLNPNDKNNLSFEAIGNMEGQDNDEDLMNQIIKKDLAFSNGNNRHSWEYKRAKVGEFAFNYSRNFSTPKKSLSASATASIEEGRENTDIKTQDLNEKLSLINTASMQKTHNYEDGVITNLKLDYTVPISPTSIFETGYKAIFRTIKADFETSNFLNAAYIKNPAASNLFDFSEDVQAAYAQIKNEIGEKGTGWQYEIGLRAELVNNQGQTVDRSTQISNNYLKIFPTTQIQYKVNESTSWKFTYGKRINRPGLGQLNPFIDITDVLNPHSGNPNLKPEIIDAFEFGYAKEFENYSLSSSLFTRHSVNTIRAFYQQQADGSVLNKPMNIGTADSYGLENMLIGKPATFYDFNASLTLFEQELNASNILTDAVQKSFNWYGKLINNIATGKSSKLQIIGNYNSAATTPQGRLIALYNIDLGFQQKLGKGNSRISIILVDAFNTLKSGSSNFTSTFTTERTQKADTRAIMITFAHSFKSAFKEKLLENKFSKEF